MKRRERKKTWFPPPIERTFTIKDTPNEDSAVAMKEKNLQVLAVFDGCGGIGSRRYALLDQHTGDYLDSNIYENEVKNWFNNNAKHFQKKGKFPRDIEKIIKELFLSSGNDFKKKYLDREETIVVGRMVKTLPSTFAMALIEYHQKETIGTFLWAGDSRGYLLHPQKGLCQLTKDDLISQDNAFENIYNDGPMSNYLNLDEPFIVNKVIGRFPETCIVITATDGAFDYLPSPMHFEALLLDTMLQVDTMAHWEEKIVSHLKCITADDVTILVQPIGFESFPSMKESFQNRFAYLNENYIYPAEKQHVNNTDKIHHLRKLWQAYQKEME